MGWLEEVELCLKEFSRGFVESKCVEAVELRFDEFAEETEFRLCILLELSSRGSKSSSSRSPSEYSRELFPLEDSLYKSWRTELVKIQYLSLGIETIEIRAGLMLTWVFIILLQIYRHGAGSDVKLSRNGNSR